MRQLSKQVLEKLVDQLIQEYGVCLESKEALADALEEILAGEEALTASQQERVWHRYHYRTALAIPTDSQYNSKCGCADSQSDRTIPKSAERVRSTEREDWRIMMRDLKRPAFMQEAAKGSRSHPAFVEIVIALLVFLVSTLIMSAGQLPILFVYLFQNEEYRAMLLSGKADIAKIQNLVLHLPDWAMILILSLEFLMILVVILYCRFFEHRRISTMGFQKKSAVSQYLLGAVGGVLFFSVAYALCVLFGGIRFCGMPDQIGWGCLVGYLIGFLIQGMAEEVLCRGYLFVSLSRRYRVSYAAVLSALFFMLLHGANSGLSFIALINLFLFGIFAALLMVRFENIWIVGAFHSLWNFVQGNIFGIQVSGNSVKNTLFLSENQQNMSLINGGAFGMEGGLCVTLVLILGIVWLFVSLRRNGGIAEAVVPPQASEATPKPPLSTAVPGTTVSQSGQRVYTQPQVRENMGTEPGETPWRPGADPLHSGQGENVQASGDSVFDADYFNDSGN